MRQPTLNPYGPLSLSLLAALLCWAGTVCAQTTTFTYQGQLNDNGSPANGSFDMQFKLYDAATAGNQVGSVITQPNVSVTKGAFTAPLDFGAAAFPGATRFLEVGVRATGSSGAYTVQSRTQITSTPYAIRALSAASADMSSTGALSATSINTGTGAPGSLALHVDGTSWFQGDTTPLPPTEGKGVAIGYTSGDYGYLFAYDYTAGTPKNLLLNSPGGNVGIGTTTPHSKLHISGDTAGAPFEGLTIDQSVSTRVGLPFPDLSGNMLLVRSLNENSFPFTTSTYFLVNSLGRVGVGSAAPDHRLAISGGPTWTNNGWAGSMELDNAAAIGWKLNAAGNGFGIGQTNGGLYFFHTLSKPGSTGNPATYDLIIKDNGHVSVNVLEIQGGADLSEKFDVGAPVAAGAEGAAAQPGLLVSIDPHHAGKLVVSDHAYDRRVAGVISGAGGVAPGMVMSQVGSLASGQQAVSLNGRVYCWADASAGPISPGDLLTTSDVPGHAMKVRNYAKAQGAIVGKAMSSLPSGRGLVLALVGLQ